MVWEPDSIEPEPTSSAAAFVVDPTFPVAFDQPRFAHLEWNRDSSHFPVALAPLAGDYARVVGSTLNGWYDLFDGFRQRWHTSVWHGYVYYAFEPNATAVEWPAIRQRAIELCRERARTAAATWRDDVVPQLRRLYADLDAIDLSRASGSEAARAWEDAWRLVERAWKIHMTCSIGPMQALVDLREAYVAADPDAPAADALRLLQGSRHVLVEMELDTQSLTEMARDSPAVAGALRAGVRDLDALRMLPGGDTFVSAVDAFLGDHGHMGQASDDLTLPSFGESPGLFLAAVAARLDHAPEAAIDRVARLARDAEALAAAARARLADRPEALERFDTALAIASAIGLHSDVHNYWIDRAAQAHFRRLVLRAGKRLVGEGVIEQPDGVFYLRRAEVPDLLRMPRDMRPVVADRQKEHVRDKTLMPPELIGGSTPTPSPIDGPPGGGAEPAAILRGVGASAGVARGPARVVAGVDEFERIRPGDIIVCTFTNPSWVPVFTLAGGLVTDLGGVTSHPAVVAREFGLPAVVGSRTATTRIADGQEIEIDGTAGTVRLIS
jgi:phosphohistidine swiveling domain-containing protein